MPLALFSLIDSTLVISLRFSPSESDANWVESLAKANVTDSGSLPSSPQSTPSRARIPPERVTSPTPDVSLSSRSVAIPPVDDLSHQVAEQRIAIATLLTEKDALQASLSKLNDIKSGKSQLSFIGYSHLNMHASEAHQKGMLLEDERSRCKSLEAELSQAKEITASTAHKLEVLTQEKLDLETIQKAGVAEIERLTSRCKELDSISSESLSRIKSLEAGECNEDVSTGRCLNHPCGIDLQQTVSESYSLQQETDKLKCQSTKTEHELSEALARINGLLADVTEKSRRWEEQDQNRQQTISLLVSEKASLTSSLQRMEAIETGAVS